LKRCKIDVGRPFQVRQGEAESLALQILQRALGVGATLVYCFIGAFILLKVTDVVVGLRATDEEEFAGLDLSEHSERAYMLGSVAE